MEIVRDKWGHIICSHGRIKNRCKDCGGSSICSHNKRKAYCKDCGGSAFCSHGKFKSVCRDCSPISFCSHGKFKSICKDCSPNSFCSHNKIKKQCKECGGSQICSHGKQKSQCRDCGGSSICSHSKQYANCRICSPNSNAFCKSCRLFFVKKSTNYLCNYCNPTTKLREKTKEIKLKNFLEHHYPILHNKSVKISDSCYNNFPDFMIQLKDKLIIIECDENAHKSYPVDCENIRMNNLQFSLKSNVIWIRFNPDKRSVSIKTKYTILKSYIDYYTNSEILNELIYLFY